MCQMWAGSDTVTICIVIILGVSRLLVNTIWSHFVVPAGITKGEKVFGLYSFSLVLQVCLLSCHMCKIAKCSVCVQGILLDEASGVSRTQQPVMPAGYQPPKIVVSSWNRRVSFSAHSSFSLGKYLLEREISLTWSHVLIKSGWSLRSRFWHDGSFSCPYREESAGMRPFTFYMLKTFSGHSSSSRRKWITATLRLSPKSSSNPMQLNLCHHVSVLRNPQWQHHFFFFSQPLWTAFC